MEQFKGYIITKDKKPIESFKDKSSEDLHTFEVVEKLPEFAGIIENGYVLIDIDTKRESEILLEIVKKLKLDTRVYKTTRGMHFFFRATERTLKNGNHIFTAIGLNTDIKLGNRNSYAIVKFDNKIRELIYETDKIERLPIWLSPINHSFDFLNMEDGDGRNQALFNYILTLQSHEFGKEEARECIRLINKFVLEDPMDSKEIETILRDESFNKPNFFGGKNGNSFLFDRFAKFLISEHNIIKIQGHLHTYEKGVYVHDENGIEHQMINYIPTLRQSQRTEVLRYINILIRDNTNPSPANYIAFNNGIYNLVDGSFQDFTDEIIITNKIPWDYNPDSYSKITDTTFDKISCNDIQIRQIMEELIGYTFYRRNELGKAFILTGDKSNGKSTYLNLIKKLLGFDNTTSLGLNEIGERFMTAELFGKLANIGDDIDDEFIRDTSVFKKATTGETMIVERKGEDPFQLTNYSKLLFSANSIPRMSDSTGAVLRRLVIIPFNAEFSPEDDDFDPYIKYKLETQESMEYLINLGLKGLKRILANNRFTNSEDVEELLYEYNLQNNPIHVFFNELEYENEIIGQSTKSVYDMYIGFCSINHLKPMSRIKFTSIICQYFNLESVRVQIEGQRLYTYQKMGVE